MKAKAARKEDVNAILRGQKVHGGGHVYDIALSCDDHPCIRSLVELKRM